MCPPNVHKVCSNIDLAQKGKSLLSDSAPEELCKDIIAAKKSLQMVNHVLSRLERA